MEKYKGLVYKMNEELKARLSEVFEKLIELGLTWEDVDEVARKEETEKADVEKLVKKCERITNASAFMRHLIELISKIRAVKAENNIPQKTLIVMYTTDYLLYCKLVRANMKENFCRMAGLSDLILDGSGVMDELSSMRI
jgi:hypothetical protein